MKTKIQYAHNHFIIAQIAYNWNIKCVITITNNKNSTKANNRKSRLQQIYNTVLNKKIKILYMLTSHTDIVETFILRIIKNTNYYGISTIYTQTKTIHYQGYKFTIKYPIIEKTRNYIINNTTKICSDYANEPFANTRNIFRKYIDISMYYTNIINLINKIKNLIKQYKYIYNFQTFILQTNIKNIINTQEKKNIISNSTRILNFTINNNINQTNIDTIYPKDLNNCHIQIINNTLLTKLSNKKIYILKKKNCTIIFINSIHKVLINHNSEIIIKINYYYTKQIIQNTNKCFQQNIYILIKNIKNNNYFKTIKLHSLKQSNAIEDCKHLHIQQVITQKIFYK